MSIKCPRCNEILYLKIIDSHIFSIKDITLTDVYQETEVEKSLVFQLCCLSCTFSGWINDYRDELSGIRKLFDEEGKLLCTCSQE